MQPLASQPTPSRPYRADPMPRDPELHAARLVELGSLVPGLVHELSNPAAVLRGNLGAVVDHADTLGRLVNGLDQGQDASALRRDLELDDTAIDLAELVGESAGALDELVSLLGDIRHYAAGAEAEAEADLASAVAAALRLATYETKYRAAVSVGVGDLPRIALCPVHLVQLVLALILNAAQALADHRQLHGDLGHVSLSARAEGDDLVVLEVRDDGPGVSPDLADRVFEPGVTSRPGARGMGLYHARNLLERAGGALVLQPPRGGGAVFVARLPALSDDIHSEAIGPVHKT